MGVQMSQSSDEPRVERGGQVNDLSAKRCLAKNRADVEVNSTAGESPVVVRTGAVPACAGLRARELVPAY